MAGETAESLACHYGMNPRDELYMSVFFYFRLMPCKESRMLSLHVQTRNEGAFAKAF